MAIAVSSSPIEITILQVPNTEVWAQPLEMAVSVKQPVFTHFPVADRNSDLDQSLDVGLALDIDFVTVSIIGQWLNVNVAAAPISILLTPLGNYADGGIWSDAVDTIGAAVTIHSYGFTPESIGTNLLWWSDIGSMSFTINRRNLAGCRRVDWGGWIYSIRKLGGKVAVYGEEGVSLLTPSGNTYGLNTIYKVGIKGRQAVCGDDNEHYFVDKAGRLFSVTDKLEKLDYSEYLSTLSSSIVMSFDALSRRIYICDGILGFVYDIDSKSMCLGYPTITGADSINGVPAVAAYGTITPLPFVICTDVYDFGTRKNKTIYNIEFGVDLVNSLWASVDYRLEKSSAFVTTNSVLVTSKGVAHIPCYGVEFRFKLYNTAYESFKLDYIKINGIIHNYSYLDNPERG